MKVFENLNRWKEEIFVSMGVSPDERFNFADEIEKALKNLIPLRKNESLTRRYFRENLCRDDRVNEWIRERQRREEEGISIKGFDYQPTPLECNVNTPILHSALLQILKDDKISFAYLYWELGSRHNREVGYEDMTGLVQPDELVNYAVDFDIDELKKKAFAEDDLYERKKILVVAKAESALVLNTDNLQSLNDLKQQFSLQVDILISMVDDQIKIESNRIHEKKAQSNENKITVEEAECEISDEFYNPKLLDGSDFVHFGQILPSFRQMMQRGNSRKFIDYLMTKFENCFSDAASLKFDESILQEVNDKLARLIYDYSERIKLLYGEDKMSKVDNLKAWKKETIECVEVAYHAVPEVIYCVDDDELPGEPISMRQTTRQFHDYLISEVTSSAETYLFVNIIHEEDDVSDVLLYNMWGQDFYNSESSTVGCLGLMPEDRAKIYSEANIDFFCERVMKTGLSAVHLCEQHKETPEHSKYMENAYNEVANLFRQLFADYQIRISKVTNDIDRIYDASLFWFRMTSGQLARRDAEETITMSRDSFATDYSRRALYYFFYNCCMPILDKIETDFINDCKELIKRNKNVRSISPAVASQSGDNRKDHVADQKKRSRKNEVVTSEKNDRSTRTDSHLVFYDHVNEKQKKVLLSYIHAHVGFNPGVEEYLYIKALVDGDYLKFPEFRSFKKEFPIYDGKNRNFSYFWGSRGKMFEELSQAHQKKVSEYAKEIQLLLQSAETK